MGHIYSNPFIGKTFLLNRSGNNFGVNEVGLWLLNKLISFQSLRHKKSSQHELYQHTLTCLMMMLHGVQLPTPICYWKLRG